MIPVESSSGHQFSRHRYGMQSPVSGILVVFPVFPKIIPLPGTLPMAMAMARANLNATSWCNQLVQPAGATSSPAPIAEKTVLGLKSLKALSQELLVFSRNLDSNAWRRCQVNLYRPTLPAECQEGHRIPVCFVRRFKRPKTDPSVSSNVAGKSQIYFRAPFMRKPSIAG